MFVSYDESAPTSGLRVCAVGMGAPVNSDISCSTAVAFPAIPESSESAVVSVAVPADHDAFIMSLFPSEFPGKSVDGLPFKVLYGDPQSDTRSFTIDMRNINNSAWFVSAVILFACFLIVLFIVLVLLARKLTQSNSKKRAKVL